MLDRQWMIEQEHKWRKESQDTQERVVQIARETAESTKIAAWAQAGTVLVGVVAIIVAITVAAFFGTVTIEDKRPTAPPTIAVPFTPTPDLR